MISRSKDDQVMKALILASGLGKRLRPLTEKNPKALIHLGKKSILERMVRLLIKNNVVDIIITTGHLENQIKDFIKTKFPSLNVTYINNPIYDKTNYIYSLWLARDAVGDDDIVLLHSDMVFEPGLLKKVIVFKDSGVLVKKSLPYPQKDFKASIEGGLVSKIGVSIEGENLRFLAPVYKFKNADFRKFLIKIDNFIKEGKTNSYAEDAFNEISGQIKLHPIYFDNEFCMEIDDFDDLKTAKKYFN